MKLTKSQLRSIKRQLNFIQSELKRLESRAQAGWLTESEKQCTCNWLAKECLRLSKQCGKYTNCPNTSRYISDRCLDMAIGLKGLAASDNKFSYRPRKGLQIYRKIIR